jgi:hypothetical protein
MTRRRLRRRQKALQWLVKSNTDPTDVLLTKPPSRRLCKLLRRERLVLVEPNGRYMPTAKGMQLIEGTSGGPDHHGSSRQPSV